jgi:hypothetical protein
MGFLQLEYAFGEADHHRILRPAHVQLRWCERGGPDHHRATSFAHQSHVYECFRNDAARAEIVKYAGSLPGSPPPSPAFKGAASPNYLHGTQPGDVQHFSFVTGKAGKYLLICPVHNHVSHGHWDWFVVSAKTKTATAVFK